MENLKKLSNWVVWRKKEVEGKIKKLPINPKTGKAASSTDAATWATFDEATNFKGQRDGIGFMFGGSGYAGIDLDNVVNDDGTLKAFAAEIVNLMNSYTEYSPSGKGLHILFKVKNGLQEGYLKRNDNIGLEMYDSGRYFTVTGKVYGNSKSIDYRDNEAHEVQKKYLARVQRVADWVYQPPTNDVWQKMFNSKLGQEIRALHDGDTSAFDGDDSRADYAMCKHLAYWTNNDAALMDSMFRETMLYRDKWDEKHGAQTYGDITIQKAIAATPEYVPTPKQQQTTVQAQTESEQTAQPQINFVFDDTYLTENFERDKTRFQKYENRKTGYENIDAKMSLYPGLYVIGAVSSLGKTTFSLQMANQLAQAGEHIMYFALEQTRFELTAKCLARLTATERNLKYSDAMTALQIRSGRITQAVREAIDEFKKFAGHSQIIECSFNTVITDITETVKAYIERYKVRPIVFVDYLQMIRPLDIRQTTKDAVDMHVRALKELQSKYDLVVFVISSLNRQNYLTVIDFESFKESGSIEYTADCVWGLQLFCMNQEDFNKDKELKRKREIVKAAKRAIPREIELCVLKNRYGVANESFYFKYYPQYDLFIPASLQ